MTNRERREVAIIVLLAEEGRATAELTSTFNGRKKEMASLLIYFHALYACLPGFFANASRRVPAYFLCSFPL
jgi:hypothetical protein